MYIDVIKNNAKIYCVVCKNNGTHKNAPGYKARCNCGYQNTLIASSSRIWCDFFCNHSKTCESFYGGVFCVDLFVCNRDYKISGRSKGIKKELLITDFFPVGNSIEYYKFINSSKTYLIGN